MIYSTSLVIIVPPSACMCEILNTKCFPQKVHHETIGRHSDISDSFSPQRQSVCMCAYVYFIISMCSKLCGVFFNWTRVSACVCPWLPLWIVGPLDRLNSEAPQPRLCNTHTTPIHAPLCLCGSGSPHHLCLVGCFSCSVMIFASPAPLRHARDHLPKLVPILPSKNVQHRPAPCQTVPSCVRSLLNLFTVSQGGWGSWGSWEYGFGTQLQNSEIHK